MFVRAVLVLPCCGETLPQPVAAPPPGPVRGGRVVVAEADPPARVAGSALHQLAAARPLELGQQVRALRELNNQVLSSIVTSLKHRISNVFSQSM